MHHSSSFHDNMDLLMDTSTAYVHDRQFDLWYSKGWPRPLSEGRLEGHTRPQVMTPVQTRISTACKDHFGCHRKAHCMCFFLWISRHANYIGFNLWTVVAHIAGHKAANQSTICEPHQENGRNGFQDPPTMLRIQHFPNTFSPKKEGTCFWLKEYPEGTESHCGDEGPVCSWEGAGVYSPV